MAAALAVPASPAAAAPTVVAESPAATGTATAAPAPAIIPTRRPYPSGGNVVIGAGVDGGNQNAQFADTVPATVTPVWRNGPPLCPQSAGAAAISISLSRTLTVVVESQYQCSSVSAYALKTGKLVWRKQYHFASTASIAYGNVYVFHDDLTTHLNAVDALALATGRTVWGNRIIEGQGGHALSIASGLVANSDTVLSTDRGKFLLHTRSDVGQPGLSLAAAGRVYYSSGYGTTATDAKGNWLWRTAYPAGVDGAWPSTTRARPSLHDGLLYVPGSKTIVIDVKTGRIVRY
ncbi:MAG: outer membrane protein assembly factor BamB family protein, partial [Curtobacterium sp.]